MSKEITRRDALGKIGGGMAALAMSATNIPGVSTDPAEAATMHEYVHARSFIKHFRTPEGVYDIQLYIPKEDRFISIGKLNTEVDYKMLEDYEVTPVLDTLGFESALEFAKEYNKIFHGRKEFAKEYLLQTARFVDEAHSKGIDIRRGNKQFINLRTALLIWVSYQNLKQDIDKQFTLGRYTFDTEEVMKRLYMSKAMIRKLLFTPVEGINLHLIMNSIPNFKPLKSPISIESANSFLEPFNEVKVLQGKHNSSVYDEAHVVTLIRQLSDHYIVRDSTVLQHFLKTHEAGKEFNKLKTMAFNVGERLQDDGQYDHIISSDVPYRQETIDLLNEIREKFGNNIGYDAYREKLGLLGAIMPLYYGN